YLRRPASAATTPASGSYPSTGNTGANPMIVVDAMRFPYIEAGTSGMTDTMNNDTVTPAPPHAIYSCQRMQPYRGGHAIPWSGDSTHATIDTHYGYSEQMAEPSTQPGHFGKYGTKNATTSIYHTLNRENDQANGGRGANDDQWDLFYFLDRDFT